MKKQTLFVILFSLFISLGFSQKTIKIACVGNSITYGSGVVNREKNAYPAQLQQLLGDSYTVKNYGVSGRTLLKKGDYPYLETNEYKEALNFIPDIVFIKLGTNDSKSHNRIHLDEFESNYNELINSFKKKNKNTRIVLLLPVPAFTTDSTRIWNPVIKDKIIPMTQTVAFKTHTEVIDLYHLFVDKQNLIPDGVHPSGLGQTIIAKRLFEVINQKEVEPINIYRSENFNIQKYENFYGYNLINFKLDSVACKVIMPKKVAIGDPWVIRARFWGHEPQADIALLERGFHIAYCDVANLFGNDEAIKRWDKFYRLMTNAGLSKKVVLEGMSRGGLIVYNWAAENPKKVAAIYADAPVLDGKSWPGGVGKGKGSPKDWENFKKVYGIKNDSDSVNFKGNPIHKMSHIAKADFPMLHVVGETDNVVPILENTVPFEKGIKSKNGNIEVIYKKENGHHPHSLQNPTSIVDFILRATNQKTNFAIIPSPSAEYRSGAGWTNGNDWWAQARDIDSVTQTLKNIDLLLIGNSITQSFGGNRRNFINSRTGAEAAKTYFKDLVWMNAGISGDRTEHILWRLKNGSYEKSNPKTVILTIGVNNFPFNNAKEIVSGIEKVVELSKAKFKNSKIILLGPLPTGIDPSTDRRQKYNDIHKLLSKLKMPKNVSYQNIISLFTDEKGFLKENYYSGDGIHLKLDGYNVWAKYLKENIN